VVNCTTPAQYFHVLRRQMMRDYRAPLVIFTPKSLLRHPKAASHVKDFATGRFQPVIDDPLAAARSEDVRRVLACSGKVYYDLVAEREKRLGDREHEIAVVRVEELYPWPESQLREVFARYGAAERWTWVQEEPLNMGPWTFVRDRLREILGDKVPLARAGRPEAASPAAGSPRVHKAQLEALLEEAFGDRS
jgi:2-oxoglutarate dehydrogenase E1 component